MTTEPKDTTHVRDDLGSPPTYQCRNCGSLGPFALISHPAGDYDLECPDCGLTEIADSPEEAFTSVVNELDAQIERTEALYIALTMFGKHTQQCAAAGTYAPFGFPCDCGLAKA